MKSIKKGKKLIFLISASHPFLIKSLKSRLKDDENLTIRKDECMFIFFYYVADRIPGYRIKMGMKRKLPYLL